MRKTTQRISDNIREQVKILATDNLSNRVIAKKLNISKTAVNKIKSETDNLDQLRTDKKRKMANELWNLAIRMKGHITKAKLDKTGAPKLVMSMAIAIDKALLLVGEVTDRIEIKTEKELTKELNELQVAERELNEAWEKAQKKAGKGIKK